MHDQKTIQAVFIRVCRDSGFTLDAAHAARLVAKTLVCHPLEVWLAMPSLDVMNEIAAGTHPVLRQTDRP